MCFLSKKIYVYDRDYWRVQALWNLVGGYPGPSLGFLIVCLSWSTWKGEVVDWWWSLLSHRYSWSWLAYVRLMPCRTCTYHVRAGLSLLYLLILLRHRPPRFHLIDALSRIFFRGIKEHITSWIRSYEPKTAGLQAESCEILYPLYGSTHRHNHLGMHVNKNVD
jgi:hypothetical protein